jgi:hypothetical protein
MIGRVVSGLAWVIGVRGVEVLDDIVGGHGEYCCWGTLSASGVVVVAWHECIRLYTYHALCFHWGVGLWPVADVYWISLLLAAYFLMLMVLRTASRIS